MAHNITHEGLPDTILSEFGVILEQKSGIFGTFDRHCSAQFQPVPAAARHCSATVPASAKPSAGTSVPSAGQTADLDHQWPVQRCTVCNVAGDLYEAVSKTLTRPVRSRRRRPTRVGDLLVLSRHPLEGRPQLRL